MTIQYQSIPPELCRKYIVSIFRDVYLRIILHRIVRHLVKYQNAVISLKYSYLFADGKIFLHVSDTLFRDNYEAWAWSKAWSLRQWYKRLIFCSITVINNLFNFRFNLRLRELKLHLHSYFSTYNWSTSTNDKCLFTSLWHTMPVYVENNYHY